MNTSVDVNINPELIENYKKNKGLLNVAADGYFTVEHIRNGEVIHRQKSDNIVVDEGLTKILDSALSGGTPVTTWYVGIFKNNYTPVAADVAATFPGVGKANEITTEIDETVRPTWTEAGVTAKSITNSASPAVFTANTTVSAYGAFMASINTLGGTTGTLLAASKFASVRNLLATDVLNITYTLTIADA